METLDNSTLSVFADIATVVISFIAVIIATYSIHAQVKQNKKQRKHDKAQREHDKLSVKPIGEIHKWDYRNHIAVLIRNNGSGVLLCNDLEFKHPERGTTKDLIDLMPEIEMDWSSFTKGAFDFSIRPGESRTLIRLEGEEKFSTFKMDRDKVRQVLKDVSVKMTYKDIYGDKVETIMEKLNSFGTTPKQAIRRPRA